MKIFTEHGRIEVWEVDASGQKIRFRGRFLERAAAILYMNGGLVPRVG